NQKSKTKPPLPEPLPYDILRHHGNDGGRSLELAWRGTPWHIEKERLFVQQNSSVRSAGKVAEGRGVQNHGMCSTTQKNPKMQEQA
uniref:Uncharacterized protein n=1 Tax=Aegilops tauschii subsp. strangulata TaxID=200361 RepID=A0A453EJD5_AEGTS